MREKSTRVFTIGTFAILYIVTSLISTVHVVDFFELSNPRWMAISLAIAFELGAAASLASLVVLNKLNRGLVWTLFIVITAMQVQGNLYFAYKNVHDYQAWAELFGLIDEEAIYQKRIIAAVSGAILPLVALGFIKSLVDYIKPEGKKEDLITKVGGQGNPNRSNNEPKLIPTEEPVDSTPISEEERDFPPLSGEEAQEIAEASDEISTPEEVVSRYYGDISLGGGGVSTEEGEILPVNSNKKKGVVSNNGKVESVNPLKL